MERIIDVGLQDVDGRCISTKLVLKADLTAVDSVSLLNIFVQSFSSTGIKSCRRPVRVPVRQHIVELDKRYLGAVTPQQ